MTLKLPSASRLGLAELCAFPWTGGMRWPAQPEHPSATRGKAVHRCAEWYVNGQTMDIDKAAAEFNVEVDDWLRQAVQNAITVLDRDRFTWREAEVPIAYDAISGIARRAESRFDKRPGEQMLIVDLIFEDEDTGALVVRDFKTGKTSPVPADETPQTRICGLAAAKLYGASEVRVELAYVGNGTYVNRGTLDSLDLEFIQSWVSQLITKLPGRTEPQAGSHCTSAYCPINTVCEAHLSRKKKRTKAS